jgi:hypothetical protein
VKVRSLTGEVDRSQPPAIRIQARAGNVTRVDAYLDGRPLATGDVVDGAATLTLPTWVPGSGSVELRGYDERELVVVERVAI